MRPTPIPDAEVWEGATRQVIAAPDGRLDNPNIAPVEALVDESPDTGHKTLSVRCVLEGNDLEHLQAGGVVWLTFWSAMVPWAATVVPPMPDAACRWLNCQRTDDHTHEDEQRSMWVNPGDRQAGKIAVSADDQGMVTVTLPALAQLLTDAGWERAR